jgi:SAM-dependent methyltransferase
MGAVQRLLGATEALAAIGAELHLKTSGQDADPDIEAALTRVWQAAGLPDIESLAPPQQAMLVGIIRLALAQAADLVAEPARPPGWTYTDPLILEGIGRGSMLVPHLLANAPEFQTVTSFLDVGTGVGQLAVSAASLWPDASIVGIDIWEPALERARANVHSAGLEPRITLRMQDVSELDDVDAYDCAWVPTFFLSEAKLVAAVPRIMRALTPDGWIVLGIYGAPPDALPQAVMTLRTRRGGGFDLDTKRAEEILADAGCGSIRTIELPSPAPLRFVIGKRPA